MAVFFQVDYDTMDVFRPKAHINSPGCSFCGEIYIDDFENAGSTRTKPCEFILLSENSNGDYYVMLLDWADGIAERKGMGYILRNHVSRSLAPGPEWKEILLA